MVSRIAAPAAVLLAFFFSIVTPAAAAIVWAPEEHALAVHKDNNISAYWPTDPVQCDLVIEGPIDEGDAEKLEAQFLQIRGNWNSFTFFLCLRSPGGNMAEALKIAAFVRATQRPSIGTVVEDGQTCASACALIFPAPPCPAALSRLLDRPFGIHRRDAAAAPQVRRGQRRRRHQRPGGRPLQERPARCAVRHEHVQGQPVPA
jgi:hypothetical protein